MNNQLEKHFDFQLYSRQLVCEGITSFKKLMCSKILIYGMRGLGVEVAKNIILKGPEKVSIFDPEIAVIRDMNSNFYLDEKDIDNKRRDIAVLKKLQLLNENVSVDFINKKNIEDIFEIILNYNIIVITELVPSNISIKIDRICRENKIYFIYAGICGLTCFLFNDFGDEHTIIEESDIELSKFKIKNIDKNENNGKVEIFLPDNENGLFNGCFVKFRDIQGMKELNYENEKTYRKIKCSDNERNIFFIGDISNYSDYESGGIVEEVIVPIKMNHQSFEKRLEEPIDLIKKNEMKSFTLINRCQIFNVDEKLKRPENELIFLSFKSIFEFLDEKKRLPKLNSTEDAKIIVQKAKQLFEKEKKENNMRYKELKDFDEKIPLNMSLYASCQIPCLTSFLGGIIAQEIIKTTGKYIPINQWQIFNFLEYLPMDSLRNRNENLPINRYTEQTAIFGEKIINELQNLKILLAGAGAVGCEMLKNLSLFGIGSKKDIPHITVVDFDKIELSNLNRQFLFLKKSIGKFKVEEAAISAENMNKEVKILPIPEKFDKENDKLFNNKFFKEKDVILISIDTNSGKEYLDKKSVLLNKPMILGAILGPQAKSETYVPFETASYGDLSLKITNNNTEKITPSCTIRYFPKRIEDCIEWARNYFNDLFIEPIIKLKKLIKENNYFECLKNETNEKNNVITLVNFLKLINENSIESLLEYCLKIFLENYTLWEKKVLKKYPLDKKNQDGSDFWDGNKIKPSNIEFNFEDNLCKMFAINYVKILSDILEIEYQTDEMLSLLKKMSEKNNLDKYIQEIEKEEEIYEKDNCNILYNKFEELYNNLMGNEELKSKIKDYKIIDFQKDNDKLGHIDLIFALSNLKANVYKLPNSDKIKTFKYVGKITPSTITSTSTIVGYNMLQLIGLIINKIEKKKLIHNYIIDLSTNSFTLTSKYDIVYRKKGDIDCVTKKKILPIPKEFCSWDKYEIEGPKTINQIIKHFNLLYQVEIDSIDSFDLDEIYSKIIIKKNDPLKDFLLKQKEEQDEKLDEYLENIYFDELGIDKATFDEKYIYFKFSASSSNEDYIAIFPIIKYKLK